MLSINRRKKYQTGKTSEQVYADTVARETAQQQVANNNVGSIQQAENMVLGSYQQPQQVFSDVAPVQNPQYLSDFTSNMVYAPTLSQYMGSDVPMKLALSNLKRKEDEFVDDFATTGVTGKDVLNPDLKYREGLLSKYTEELNAIAKDPNMRGRDKYKATAAVKNRFNNDLGLQRMYQNKANRDAFARQQQKDAEDSKITFRDAELNLADYDKEYENQKGVGENYTQGYNSKGFARIVNNEKFVNDALQDIEIDGNKYDTTGGYFSNGFYFVKNKGGEGYKQISAEKVYTALEGAINNNALLKARIEDEARVNTLNVNPDDYKQKYISNGTKVLEELKGKIDKATGEDKEALQQQYNTLATNIQTVNTLDANGIRKVAMNDYATNYKENLRRNASKKLKFEKETFNDQQIELNAPNFWMFKRGIVKGDEEEERLKRENQVVPIQGAEGKELNLPATLDDYGKDAENAKSEYDTKLLPGNKGTGAILKFLYKGKEISKAEYDKGIAQEEGNKKASKLSTIQKADKLANEDSVFKGLYDYNLRNGKGTAKERANEAYKQYIEEKKKYSFNNGITISNRTQAKNLADAIQQGDLAGTTKDGLPIMTWLDKQAKELDLTTENGKSITSGIGLLDNMGKSMLFNPYTQEVTINVRGKQLSVPATNNMKAEMQVLKDLKNSRETGNPVNTVWRLGELQISGQAITDYSRGTANTMFIPNPQTQYELNELQKIQNQIPNYDISKGIPLNIIDAMYQKKSQTTGFGGTTDQDNTGKTQTKIINYDKYE
jgi:hypothetical protein